jgi:hypothetical protein
MNDISGGFEPVKSYVISKNSKRDLNLKRDMIVPVNEFCFFSGEYIRKDIQSAGCFTSTLKGKSDRG